MMRSLVYIALISALTAFGDVAGAQTKLSRTVESTLDITFDSVEEVREVERRVFLSPLIDTPRYVLETELRRTYWPDEKGVDGNVQVKAWTYHPSSKRREDVYSFEAPGIDMTYNDKFLILKQDSDALVERYYFIHTGQYAFEAVYGAASAALRLSDDDWNYKFYFAGFSPWSDEIPPSASIDGGIVGLLAITGRNQVLSKALLVTRDRAYGENIARVVDEHHKLDFVRSDTRRVSSEADEPRHNTYQNTLLRLRFWGSNFDLFFPLKPDGFDYERLQLPDGFRLIPLP